MYSRNIRIFADYDPRILEKDREVQIESGIISAGVSTGTVQVPGSGQPIILMADRQTSGGYARIANVITVDRTLLAQMRPGDKIRFKETTMDIAQQLYLARHNTSLDLR